MQEPRFAAKAAPASLAENIAFGFCVTVIGLVMSIVFLALTTRIVDFFDLN